MDLHEADYESEKVQFYHLVDIDFAKRQLELFTREWYMHPNGQLPAYEWAFNDVNPPAPVRPRPRSGWCC